MYDILRKKEKKRRRRKKYLDEDSIDSNRAVECQKCIFSYIRIAIRYFPLLEEK